MLDGELLKVGITPPPFDESDESTVNKVFEAVGLPVLAEHNTIAVQQGSGAGLPSQPSLHDSGFGSSDGTAVHALGNDPSLQLATSSTSLGGVGQHGMDADLEAMGFDDFSQWSWEDTVSPDWPWMSLFATDIDPRLNVDPSLFTAQNPQSRPPGKVAAPPNGASALGTVEAPSEDEVDQELVTQIAARFGSLHVGPDGQLRYFGTPTNAHLFNSSKHPGPYTTLRSTRVDGARLLRNADLDQAIDPEVEAHLIELYFTWHNSCHPVIDKSMYWTIREQATEGTEDSGFYSEVLTNAMQVASSCLP